MSINLSQKQTISTLLHELGHFLDDSLMHMETDTILWKAYHEVYNGKPNKRQIKLVLSCENRAWLYGRGIAKLLKIRLGTWYNLDRKESLKSYRNS